MLGAERRRNPDTVAVLAFSARFCKRPVMTQLPMGTASLLDPVPGAARLSNRLRTSQWR